MSFCVPLFSYHLYVDLLLRLHLCFPVAMPCQTTLTELCGRRGRTSVFWYLARAEQVKQKHPRRSSSITLSPAQLMIVWLHSVTAYCSPTLFWRYLGILFNNFYSLHQDIFLSYLFCGSAALCRLSATLKHSGTTTPAALGNTWTSSLILG